MKAAPNPYRPAPGSPPPALVGRDAELSAVLNAAATTLSGAAVQPIIFRGLRGMGKTVLLRRCAAELEAVGAITIYGEAGDEYALVEAFRQSIAQARRRIGRIPQTLSDAFDAILKLVPVPVYELPNEGGEVALRPQRRHRESLAEALHALNEAARKHGHFLAVCIDEVQDAKTEQLAPVIRFIHDSHGGGDAPALFLGAGLPNVMDHLKAVKTYTERWRAFDIGMLSHQETISAIADPALEQGVAFSHEALKLLAETTAGYPFFVQDYASAMWSHQEEGHINLATVKQVIPGVQKELDRSYYGPRFRTLTPREIRYVLAIVDLGGGLLTVGEIAKCMNIAVENLSSIRSQLIKKDILVAPAPGLVEFRMPLSERYVANYRDELTRRAQIGRPHV